MAAHPHAHVHVDPAAPKPSSLTAARRDADLASLADGGVVDVLVVGGGATGAGVALDAATRGLSVALVEKGDLATGTSRWSSKLVHGGLRYLGRGELGLAWESARERHTLLTATAPHLTRALPLMVPSGAGASRSQAAQFAVAARAGDALRAAVGTPPAVLPRPRQVDAAEARRLVPAIAAAGLRGGSLTWEGQLVDDARFVVALARTAAAFGAKIITYAHAEEVHGDGAVVTDRRHGGSVSIRARHVVNATGVWADQLDDRVQLQPSRGTHLVVSAERLGHPSAALTLPVAGERHRYVFALPTLDGLVHIGLTDVPTEGEPEDAPRPDDDEVDFLLTAISRGLETPLERDDVLGAYAGLRPLLAGAHGATADLSRRHRVFERGDGLLTVVGGKLTTYRAMAADVVDTIAARPGVRAGRCRTRHQPLVGAAPRATLDRLDEPVRLVQRYGAEAGAVAAFAAQDPAMAAPVAPGASVLGCELAFAAAHEGALTVEDLLDRRTRIGLVAADRARALGPAKRALAVACGAQTTGAR